jgi:hypothetical protein
MAEASLLAAFIKHMRKYIGHKGLVQRHVDAMTSGTPDVSVTLNGGTCWLETKFVHKKGPGEQIRIDIGKRAIQHHNMKILAAAGTAAFYLVWTDIDGKQSTMFVHPNQIMPDGKIQFITSMTLGHDHDWALAYICTRISARFYTND